MGENNKKQLILQAAREIISEKGLVKSNISEIAKNAGVVDSIIYHYFKNKEDLLFCVLGEQLKTVTKELLFHFEGIMGPVSKLGKMIWFHLSMSDVEYSNARIMKNLLFECRSNKNFYLHEGYKELKNYTGIMFNILKSGVEENYFREDLNLRLVRDMIFGLLDEESINCLASKEVEKTTPDFESVMSLILAMIGKNQQSEAASANGESDKTSRILQAAISIFAEKGYNKATMLEIAARAGVAEGTIYEYFKNKRDLLFCIPKEQFKYYRDSLQEMNESDHPVARLRRMIQSHFCLFMTDRDFMTIFLNDIKLNREFYTTEAYSYYSGYYDDMLNDILDKGKKRDIFRSDVNNRVYRNLYIGTFTHLAIRWFILGRSTPIEMMEEFGEATSLLCRALLKSPYKSSY